MQHRRFLPRFLLVSLCLALATPLFAKAPAKTKAPKVHALEGIASWYGPRFKKTASGERYDPESMTGAHRTLPFGTLVRVTRVSSQKSVVVRINNRGPYTRGRVIDLSRAAARELRMMGSGITKVRLEVLSPQAAKR